MSTGGLNYLPYLHIEEAIIQLREGDFKCARCRNYKGGCGCEKGVLILVVGQDMSMCQYYDQGIQCRYCGKIT